MFPVLDGIPSPLMWRRRQWQWRHLLCSAHACFSGDDEHKGELKKVRFSEWILFSQVQEGCVRNAAYSSLTSSLASETLLYYFQLASN